jgi:hypothetical protein
MAGDLEKTSSMLGQYLCPAPCNLGKSVEKYLDYLCVDLDTAKINTHVTITPTIFSWVKIGKETLAKYDNVNLITISFCFVGELDWVVGCLIFSMEIMEISLISMTTRLAALSTCGKHAAAGGDDGTPDDNLNHL